MIISGSNCLVNPVQRSPLEEKLSTSSKTSEVCSSVVTTPRKDVELAPKEDSLNISKETPTNNIKTETPKKKKKKSKSKDRDKSKTKEKKEKKRSKSKKRDKDNGAPDSKGKERKRSRKKSKHKRSRSKKETPEAIKSLLTQTPLGERSPLVCGMSPPNFDMNASSSTSPKASGDIALLMAQVQAMPPGKCNQLAAPDESVNRVASGIVVHRKNLGEQSEAVNQTASGIVHRENVREQSKAVNQTASGMVVHRKNVGEQSEAVNQTASETVDHSKNEGEGSGINAQNNILGEESAATSCSGFKKITSERKPLVEKTSSTMEKEAMKRGKKRHRHKEDKEDTTPEKKKQASHTNLSLKASI